VPQRIDHAGVERDRDQRILIAERAVVVGLVPDTRSILTTEGVQGGGTLAADRTLRLDINTLVEDLTPAGAADFVATFDTSAGTHKKVLLNNLPGGGGGGAPTGASYVVIALDATLTAERRLQPEAAVLSLTDGGANGDVTIGVAANGITNAKLAQMAANTVKANPTALLATPADLAVGANTVVGRAAGDIVAATLVTAQIGTAQVTYAKIQDVSATDRVLGRSSLGAGVVEEIPCTAAGRALIDDADAAAQRTTLGLGTVATESVVPIVKGGSGQTTQQTAINTLTNVAAATNEHVLTKDTATGNAIFKAAPGGSTPTGTGFRHITAGVEDAAAKLVDTADINNDQVTYAKIQNTPSASVLLGRGSAAGAGDYEPIELGTGLTMTGTVLSSSGGITIGLAVALVQGTALL